MPGQSRPTASYWAEALLALAVGLSLGYNLYHLFDAGYLPEPYFYEAQDTWMDWFNTAYWAHHPGAYDSWATIYPPLSFVVLKVLTNGACYAAAEGYTSRDCDWYGAVTLHLIYLVNVVLTWRTFKKIDRRTAVPRTFAMCAGLPMTFGLERGNLILLCYTCVLLAYGPLVRSARLRWIFAGLAVNFKIYLIGPVFAQILKRRWRWFEGALIATVLIYLISFAIMGAGSPIEIYGNIARFTTVVQAGTVLDLWYATTYKPLITLLNGSAFPVAGVIGSWPVEFWAAALPLATLAVQATIAAAASGAAWRPAAVPMHRLVFLSIALPLVTSESGGYTQIFLVLFVFMERFRGVGRPIAIVLAYLLCIAIEIPIDRIPPLARDSFLTGRPVTAEYAIGALIFLRPLMVWMICVAMSLVTIREVLANAREDGWDWRRRKPVEGTVS